MAAIDCRFEVVHCQIGTGYNDGFCTEMKNSGLSTDMRVGMGEARAKYGPPNVQDIRCMSCAREYWMKASIL